ncbi:M56 family metallopeptidase [Mangrovihabitans endophyticus]|uniref:Peptidase M48 domain-containing protein n=1 Tax=Mangrovihabitans endophyticus TaxID=1751298 RepID=A0A8J3C7P7_9ACTN|nr:M56 family metallopeptidase [Mangrovihabitans endophyticus]GGL17071.1 hypothetical protein GCM10012284_59580 [Mangrovihabitans endophyticus]
MTALLLGALGLTLSLLVPPRLAAARWPDRAPAAAVALWQAITLAGVLCALGVVLAGPEELVRAVGAGRTVAAAALLGALAVAALIVARLLVSLAAVGGRSRARRARHRMLVDLLDTAEGDLDIGELERGGAGGGGAGWRVATPGLRVLDGSLPIAYCVAGRHPRVVLSDGALRVLDARQVAAVIAHEQAHLRHRHEVVRESFTAFYRAVPGLLRSRAPLDAVHLLLEMVADDAARRRCGAPAVRVALERLTEPMADTPEAGDAARARRVARLSAARSPGAGVAALVAAAGLLILPTVIVVLPWITRALNEWPL